MRGFVVAQSLTVDMPDHRRALRAARPVAAGFVVARRKSSAIRLRAGQRVVLVGGIATAVDDITLLGKRGLFGQIVLTMQVIDVLGDDDALVILPGPPADAIARIDRRMPVCRLRAEIGVPGMVARSSCLRQLLAEPVRTRQSAEIRSFARSGTGDEEAHVGLLCVRAAADG